MTEMASKYFILVCCRAYIIKLLRQVGLKLDFCLRWKMDNKVIPTRKKNLCIITSEQFRCQKILSLVKLRFFLWDLTTFMHETRPPAIPCFVLVNHAFLCAQKIVSKKNWEGGGVTTLMIGLRRGQRSSLFSVHFVLERSKWKQILSLTSWP